MQKNPKEKTILTDVDGCLVDWNLVFRSWMNSNGYSSIKTNTGLIEDQYSLPTKQVRMLITEFNKTDNIASLPAFDDSVLYVKKLTELGYKFICITSIKKYKDAGLYWIEDNIDQYNAGVQVGLKSFYLNKNSLTTSWKEIYSRIKYDII